MDEIILTGLSLGCLPEPASTITDPGAPYAHSLHGMARLFGRSLVLYALGAMELYRETAVRSSRVLQPWWT
jgi:hypothetical protein